MHIDHIALWVRDLETMRQFYETYFGAVANDKYVNPAKRFSSYFLTFADGGARLEIMHIPDLLDVTNQAMTPFVGLTHIAISVGSETEVDTLTEVLRSAGYTIAGEPRRTGDGYYESIVLDPESNRIEITS